MKNKLVIRILGSFASALVIASVFIPFVSVTGYSQSLWQANVSTLYLPIMILVFGVIGVLVFAINKKTELAFASTGALLFFLIMQTIPIIEQGAFGSLSVGYYCLAVGTVLMGVVAFIAGIKPKQKAAEQQVIETNTEVSKEETTLNQIDRLYNNETIQTNDMQITQHEGIQPLSNDLPLSPLQPTINVENKTLETNNEPIAVEPVNNDVMEMPIMEQPTQISAAQPISIEEKPMVQQPTVVMESNKTENVALKDLTVDMPSMNTVEPIKSEPINNSVNPVVAEFNVAVEPQTSILSKPVEEPKVEEKESIEVPSQPIQPLSSATVDLLANNNQNNVNDQASNLDIFG